MMINRITSPSMRFLVTVLIVFTVAGCAGLTSFKEPKVSIVDFRILPISGFTPEFEIGLKISNPNKVPIILQGVDYTIELNDKTVVTGVATSLPTILPLSDGSVILSASPDFSTSFKVVRKLISQRSMSINYRLNVNLDVGTVFPVINISRTGNFSLKDLRKMTKII